MIRLYHRFLPETLTNTYLLYQDGLPDATIVNPGGFDVSLLKMIEDRGLYVRSVLATNARDKHTRGIATVLRIYDAKIYMAQPDLFDVHAPALEGGEELMLAGIRVSVVAIPSLSMDSLLFSIDGMVFVGDFLGAGTIYDDVDAFGRAYLIRQIRESILVLPPETIILPSHGPPTMVAVEAVSNPALGEESH